jgi:hypothetical protein
MLNKKISIQREEDGEMKSIDWARKLTSRKFWTAVASFVSMMIVAFGGTENSATQIAAIIMAGASVIAYIIGEGLTDAANAGTDNTIENESDEEE